MNILVVVVDPTKFTPALAAIFAEGVQAGFFEPDHPQWNQARLRAPLRYAWVPAHTLRVEGKPVNFVFNASTVH